MKLAISTINTSGVLLKDLAQGNKFEASVATRIDSTRRLHKLTLLRVKSLTKKSQFRQNHLEWLSPEII